jgi:hypothetical protein
MDRRRGSGRKPGDVNRRSLPKRRRGLEAHATARSLAPGKEALAGGIRAGADTERPKKREYLRQAPVGKQPVAQRKECAIRGVP